MRFKLGRALWLIPRTAIGEMFLSGTALAAGPSVRPRPAASALPLRSPQSERARYSFATRKSPNGRGTVSPQAVQWSVVGE